VTFLICVANRSANVSVQRFTESKSKVTSLFWLSLVLVRSLVSAKDRVTHWTSSVLFSCALPCTEQFYWVECTSIICCVIFLIIFIVRCSLGVHFLNYLCVLRLVWSIATVVGVNQLFYCTASTFNISCVIVLFSGWLICNIDVGDCIMSVFCIVTVFSSIFVVICMNKTVLPLIWWFVSHYCF